MGVASVGVGVVDTGFDMGHPDSPARLMVSRDFVTGGFVDRDDDGHGTHVAGIIGASANNSTGVAGVAPGVTVYVSRYTSSTSSTQLSNIASAILLQAQTPEIRVINLSIGWPVSDPTWQYAIQQALTAGKIVVVAAGNCADAPNPPQCPTTNATLYPAAYDGVIAVASVGPTGARATYSNYGSYVRNGIAAPGGAGSGTPDDPYLDILSTYPGWKTDYFGYYAMAGTSMAAPFVSGVAGLMLSVMLSVNPNLTRDQVIAILRGSAQPAGGSTPNDYYGAGIVDAAAAVATAAAYSVSTATPTAVATPVPAATPIPTRTPAPAATPSPIPPGRTVRLLVPAAPRASRP